MPYSCGTATHGVAARNRARMESIVIAARTLTPASVCVRPGSGRHSISQARCNSMPNRSQRTNQDFDTRRKISLSSRAFWMRPTSGRAKTASVIGAINQRADPAASLPVLILTVPNNPFLHSSRATRLQLRCSPSSRGKVRTLFSPSICIICGADGGAPV